MRIAAVLSMLLAVVLWDSTANASCRPVTYFAPSSGARIPPGATVYAFPALGSNVVVRVIEDGREVDAFTTLEAAGSRPAVAVNLESVTRAATIEVSYVGGTEEYPLGSASYIIDDSIAEPVAELAIKRVSRDASRGLPACVSHDFLHFDVDARAPAYRFEWARSERAYLDGDRDVAIVKRSEGIDGNVFSVGDSGCGQNVIPLLSLEETLFVGVAPIGYQGPRAYRVPGRPMKIELSELPNKSWDELFGDRLVEPREERRPTRLELERELRTQLALQRVLAKRTNVGLVVLGVFLGLLMGWPIGLVLGRVIFGVARRDPARS